MDNRLIIGFSGLAQSGKDTRAASILKAAEAAGIKVIRRALADPLKEECARFMSPIMGIPYEEILRQMHDVEEKKRWRKILQWWGTEFRRYDDVSYWVNIMKAWVDENYSPSDKVIVLIPDIRFFNEVELVKSFPCGLMVKVEKAGMVSNDDHSSENELANYTGYDAIMVNNSEPIEMVETECQSFLANLIDWAWGNVHEKCDNPGRGLDTVQR